MKSIIYIFFVAAHFSLYGHVHSAYSGFTCDPVADNKPSQGVCAPEGIQPNGGDRLIYYIPNAFNAEKVLNSEGFFLNWSCAWQRNTVSYCCTIAPEKRDNLAAACRRQVSA
ncbi:hypothetical protein DFH28DRAFT_960044 [Melampsora americana]|nr:hypothetical protein DFH28DRAFT_960044 [Melampsora americana]